MKFSQRLIMVVLTAVAGLIVLACVALLSFRATMLEDRRAEIRNVLILTANQIEVLKSLESSGKLSRDDAQAQAITLLSAMRNGPTTYVWARTTDALGLVHPNPKNVGSVDFGKPMPNGKKTFEDYLDKLAKDDVVLIDDMTAKPNSDGKLLPKINGITKVKDWNWVIGYGIFVDDINARFWGLAARFLIVGLIVLGVVVAFSAALAKQIYARLGGEPDYAAEVALAIAGGDLARQVEVRKSGENLLSAIAQMQGNLRAMIERIQVGSVQLHESTLSIRAQMTEINHSSVQSASATSSTAAAIEELSVSIDHISENVRDTEKNSARASELARGGREKVELVGETIRKISVDVAQSSSRIETLMARSNEIGTITSVIREIADQTNLLALNAAIEAARAGEQGRGFAVVADEVRKLAERTSAATLKISDTVSAIQTETQNVKHDMQAILPQVDESVQHAAQAVISLQEITQGATETLSKLGGVAVATDEQSQAGSLVAQNVEKIAGMVEESAAALQAANADVARLDELAGELKKSVARFRL